MNRVIKFRAWDNGKMYTELSYITMGGGAMSANPDKPLIKPVLMQFTGLLDKNGKEIYDKDLFEYNGVMCQVFWDENIGAFLFGTDDWNRYLHEARPYGIEIIGNIHQHPHLLTQPSNQ